MLGAAMLKWSRGNVDIENTDHRKECIAVGIGKALLFRKFKGISRRSLPIFDMDTATIMRKTIS